MHADGETPLCPHCEAPLSAFELPDNTGWQTPFQLACFNDECPYYRRSWVWMFDHYGVKAAYRYRVDPENGQPSPLAVWSPTALKDRILDGDVVATVEHGNDVIGGEAGERGEARGERAPAHPEEEAGVGVQGSGSRPPTHPEETEEEETEKPPRKDEGE